MNEAGARREPFLFGVDFELSEGFFVSDPLGQQEILFEAGGVTNSPVVEGGAGMVLGKRFFPKPMSYEVYREKFAVVREGLARGDSFLLNLLWLRSWRWIGRWKRFSTRPDRPIDCWSQVGLSVFRRRFS